MLEYAQALLVLLCACNGTYLPIPIVHIQYTCSVCIYIRKRCKRGMPLHADWFSMHPGLQICCIPCAKQPSLLVVGALATLLLQVVRRGVHVDTHCCSCGNLVFANLMAACSISLCGTPLCPRCTVACTPLHFMYISIIALFLTCGGGCASTMCCCSWCLDIRQYQLLFNISVRVHVCKVNTVMITFHVHLGFNLGINSIGGGINSDAANTCSNVGSPT